MPTRRQFLSATGGLAAALASGRFVHGAERARPNIIWIMSDDHAAHAVSAYGSRINRTPNIDRLANEGMRFDNCFCTNSLCGPARATLLTGTYSHVNGFKDNAGGARFDGSQITFPKLLQQAGYRTGMVGKWHLNSDPTGFDYWNILPGQGVYNNPPMIELGERKTREGYVTDIITDDAIRFAKESADKPFCLLYHHKAPHRGWTFDEKHASLYRDDIPEPATYNDDYANRASAAAHADMRVADMPDWVKWHPTGLTDEQRKSWNYQRYMKSYLRCIASVDDNIGRMLDYLDESGLAKNTIVAYTSDNGFFLGDHGWFDKRFMYEESLRLPFLVRYPGTVKPKSVDKHMVANIDFGPTLLDLAGVPVPERMQGESMAPLLKGERNPKWRESFYYHYYEYPQPHRARPHVGVRTDRHKLIHFYTIDEWELFDLQADPHELRNIYAEPKNAALVTRMKAELQRLREQYKDNT